MKKNRIGIHAVRLLAFACLFWSLLPVAEAGVAETKHNLAAFGPGTIKALNTFEICIFCHTPHKSRKGVTYLWNRYDSQVDYIPYQSSTMKTTVGQPTGASKLCLSCHDGTVALGMLSSRDDELPFQWLRPGEDPVAIRFMPAGSAGLIGTDLSTSHPVSLTYDAGLAAANHDLVDPDTLTAEVRLDQNDQLQCTACHDPHDNTLGKFLLATKEYSILCLKCHAFSSWANSAHATSTALWNSSEPAPWPPGSYDTVAKNACANCHVNHGAGSAERLLRYGVEENNCLACHNGNVAGKNIDQELDKPSAHRVQDYLGKHDPVEDFSSGVSPSPDKHVECVDCHNSHRASNNPVRPALGDTPFVSGATAEVSGIDIGGAAVHSAVYTYEICFKCHGDTNVIATSPVTRQIEQLNTRLEFDPINPSFHPVAGKRLSLEVPSLESPLTEQSRIGCLDCHNNDSDQPGVPQGPHGSNNPYLLARTYSMDDFTMESSSAYALCYSCHNQQALKEDRSGFSHNAHVVTQSTPCSACHDPHGISSLQGNSANNSHLINFDLNIVSPDGQGRLYFEDLGTFKGQCFLSCHGVVHDAAKSYGNP
ncbi:MAG: hypothetical protein K0A99_08455 [Desulfoarculaceae bacterium]|nr:hypothetical protein [Desulfoarculaceae bacterium]